MQKRENKSYQVAPRKRPAAAAGLPLPDDVGSDDDSPPPAVVPKRPAAAAAADLLVEVPDAAAAHLLELPGAVEAEEGVGSANMSDDVDWLMNAVSTDEQDTPMPQAQAAPEIPVGPEAACPVGLEPAGPATGIAPLAAPPVGPEAAGSPVGPEEISDAEKVLNKIKEFCASDFIKNSSLDEVDKISPSSPGYLKLTAFELRAIETQLGCSKCRQLPNGCTTCKQMKTKQHVLQYLRERAMPEL